MRKYCVFPLFLIHYTRLGPMIGLEVPQKGVPP
nr:MAG TPA: hypothetical protein [Caudoviricetes sp.]